jgi:uncharacterized protein YcgI (DUF1989 family)
MSRQTVPARKGAGYMLNLGQKITIINTHGTQVVDFWAVSLDDPSVYLSMVHTRSTLYAAWPSAGDLLYDTHRAPILRFVADSSPGIHDTLLAPCDPERYRIGGVEGFHDSCANNFRTVARELGLPSQFVPDSFNLFMNIPWTDDGHLLLEPTKSAPGDSVTFEALRPLAVIVSSCPMDLSPVNSGMPVDFDVEISG